MALTMEGRRRTAVSLLQVAVVVVLVAVCVDKTSAFNVDLENIVQYSGRYRDSMFGFSVAMFKDRGESWVLVGAPEAQSQVQREVTRGGAVYRCSINRAANCEEVPFDQTGNMQNSSNYDMDNKSNQWFGATLSVADSGSAVVACAPRYVYYPQIREERHEPVGTCWVARENFRSFHEYSPCRTSEWGYHRKGVCQAGFSASMSHDGSRLFMGAPGSHYWQGLLFSVDATVFMPYLPPESIRVNITSGQLYVINLHTPPDVYQTKQGDVRDDDTYLGYSVTVGKFDGPGNTTVAVGRPKGEDLQGVVEFYTIDVKLFDIIIGTQLGSYFGYSLCASDMDGDGLDDLVVGAPLYTERNNEKKYETGRVFVYFQKYDFQYNNVSDGVNSRSRFGLSVCSLGDINKDGYGDIAVGAPYDHFEAKGEGFGQGAVYIYLGSRSGMKDKPSQVIYAKDVAPSLSTFGFSVSGGQDLDGNEYPDLVVGSYEANAAAFFRARPIVKVEASIQSNITSKQINLKNFNCKFDGGPTNCITLKMCLRFSGVGVDNWHAFTVQITLDSARPGSPRMFFRETRPSSSRNITFTAARDTQFCQDFDVYIKPNIRDKLSALEVEMRYTLNSSRQTGRFPRLAPVLDLYHPPVTKDSLHIIKNCGPDNICIPDLKMKVTESVKQYLLGSGENFNLTILVENRGEDAFESTFALQIPPGLNYINTRRLDKNKEVTVQCSPPSSSAVNRTLLCDIGNPLPNKTHVQFIILMEPRYEEGLPSSYHFTMKVNSTNPEKPGTRKDNEKEINVPISIKSDITLAGGSKPSDVFWNSMDYNVNEGFKEESEIGPLVIHEHRIKNEGPANILEADVYLVVPTSTFAGENLLYILEQPETTGPITCDVVPEANYLHLKLDQKRAEERGIAGTAEQSVATISSSGSSSSSSSSSSSHNRGHIQKVVGTDDGKVMRKEEGSERGTHVHSSAGYDQSGSGYHQSGSGYHQSGSGYHQSGSEHGQSGDHNLSGVDYDQSGADYDQSGSTYHESVTGLHQSASGHHQSASGHHQSASGHHQSGSGHHQSGSGHDQSGSRRQHQSSHSFQNSSQSTWRKEYTHGDSGPVVHSSSNFSASWSADGGPVHHYENHSSGGDTLPPHHNGRSHAEASDHGSATQTHHVETSHSGRGFSEHAGTHHVSNTIDHGPHAGAGDEDEEEEEDYEYEDEDEEEEEGGETGGGYYGAAGGSRGQAAASHNGSYHSSSGRTFSTSWSSQDNAGSRDTASRDNAYGSRDNAYGSRDNAYGSRDNAHDSQDNARGYYSGSGRYDGGAATHDSSDRQGQNATRGSFQHWSTWSSSGGSQQQGSGHRSQWGSSGGRDNVDQDTRYGYSGSDFAGRDNVDEDRGRGASHGYESRVHTHQYASGDNDDRSGSHYSSSGRAQGSSHAQSHGSRWGDEGSRQYHSSERTAGHDQEGTRVPSAREQRVNAYERARSGHGSTGGAGTGNFYTSSVLIGDGGQDLGYAARGYGQPQDSLASLAARQRPARRSTTLDPDLADIGSTFTDNPRDGDARLRHRYQRSTTDSLQEKIKCNVTNCTIMYCKLGLLTKEKEAHVTLRMRAWVPTMKKYKDDRVIKTSSRMALRVTKLPYIGAPHEEIIKDHEVFTNIISTDSPTVPDIVPLWVVVLSAVAGTIILLLLIFLLYKCGFFKRNRPSDSAEKEPLNRNGHFSAGDEAL